MLMVLQQHQQMLLGQGLQVAPSSSSSYSAAWMLAAMCLMILSITSSLSPSPAVGSSSMQLQQQQGPKSASQDLVSMLNQTLVLAFSRIVMMQVGRAHVFFLPHAA